jgi:hypothetical protein
MNQGKDPANSPSIHSSDSTFSFFAFFPSKFSPNTRKIIISDEKSQILFSHSEPHKANLNNTKKRNPELIHMEGAEREKGTLPLCYIFI